MVPEEPRPFREPSEVYDYYFESERTDRPAFVTRLLERKHRKLLDLAVGDSDITSIAELGPGEGFVAREARTRGIGYVGIEASSKGAAILRTQGIDVMEAKVPPVPVSVGPVDLLYASHMIEHLPGPDDVLALLRDAKEALAPGGRLVLVFPDFNWMKKTFWDCDYTHQWPSTPRRVSQVAHDAGYRILDQHACCLHVTGLAAILLRFVVKLYPHRLLAWLDRKRADFWFRGSLLFAADHVMVLSPEAGPQGGDT